MAAAAASNSDAGPWHKSKLIGAGFHNALSQGVALGIFLGTHHWSWENLTVVLNGHLHRQQIH